MYRWNRLVSCTGGNENETVVRIIYPSSRRSLTQMKSAILVMGVTVVLAVPMLGDVTIKQTTSGKGMGVSAGGTTTTYIKGMKMRSEVETMGTVMTTIFDVENQKM